MPHIHNQDDFDYVAANGDTHVVLASGERIELIGPLTEGKGTHLVAGKMTPGGFRDIATLPAPRKMGYENSRLVYPPVDLSADCRWLGIPTDGETLTLFEVATGTRGFVFQTDDASVFPFCRAIHPDGDCIAYRTPTAVRLMMPDGKLWHEARFPQNDQRYPAAQTTKIAESGETLAFSASGHFLWFTHVGPEKDSLFLLEVPTLKVLDQVAVPHNPDQPYDEADTGWCEAAAHVNFTKNAVCIVRQAGDTLLSVTFHTIDRDRITTCPQQLDIDHGAVNGDPLGAVVFSADGARLTSWTGYDALFEANTTDFTIHAESSPSRFGLIAYHYEEITGQPGYWRDFLFVPSENNTLHILQSGNLKWKGVLNFAGPINVLPNGMLLRMEKETTTVMRFHLAAEAVPVVFELDAELGVVARVWQKRDGNWVDVSESATVVEPNFRFGE